MITPNTIAYVGVDVSKDDLHCSKTDPKTGKPALKRFANTAAGVRGLLRWLPRGAHVVLEATGGYEMRLVCAAHAKGWPVSPLNPLHVRNFARSMGMAAKNDAADAEAIRLFAQARRPEPAPKPEPAQERLAELLDARDALVGFRAAQKCSLPKARDPLVRSTIRETIAALSKKIDALEKEVRALIAASPRMKAAAQRLRTIPGVGPIIAAGVLAYFPEAGSCNRKQAAALPGLAPYDRDSGRKKGKRFIAGGRDKLRRLLYLATLSATRFNKTMGDFYRRLIDRGKPNKVARVAVARKIAIQINTLSKPFSLPSHAS